ncbi:hypothetical protein RvY_13903 [Ramazzottius varieornatus]|uniref:Protein quiver n=1 Tax=Ramazzottius varieornatus TaxID=947166 RepID=A0A1D1VPI4_RAMVA|nr:hypothetical protein RvY_13903 [Ramazzottius varieornatus]
MRYALKMSGWTFFLFSVTLCSIEHRVLGQFQMPMVAQSDFVMKIRCYECDSSINPECSNPSELISMEYLWTDCPGIPGESDRCLKTTGPGVLIRRGCGGLPADDPIVRAADGCFIQGDVQSCICATEQCNGSSRPSMSSSILCLVLLTFMWRLRS